jgi:hypothetical protein
MKLGPAAGETATATIIEGLSHGGPTPALVTSIATGKDIAFGEARSISRRPDPKLLYWVNMLPGGWETFRSIFNLEDVAITDPKQINPRTMTEFNGHYWQFPKGEAGSLAAWKMLDYALLLSGSKRGIFQQVPPWIEFAKARAGIGQKPVTLSDGTVIPRSVVPGQNIKLPLDPRIDTGLLEVMRNLGMVSVSDLKEPSIGVGLEPSEEAARALQLQQNRQVPYDMDSFFVPK